MRSVGWITLCLVSLTAWPVASAYSQSFPDVVSQTARSVTSSFKAVERAAQNLAAEGPQTGTPTRKQASARRDQAMRLAPPDPERKPRALLAKPQITASWPKVLPPNGEETRTKAAEDKWSAVEINLARARCVHLFKSLDAVTLPETPIKEGACGDPAPVRLISVGTNPAVKLSPAPIVNCQMVAALHDWVEKDLQPLARKHFRSPIVAINVMSSYSCRNTYGRSKGRLSEHGRANALDIRGFVTKKGVEPELLAHWGPTKREVTAARRIAAEKAAERKAQRLAEAKRRIEARRQAQVARLQKAETAPSLAMLGSTGSALYQTIVNDDKDEVQAASFNASKLGGPKPPSQAPLPEFKTEVTPTAAPAVRAPVNTRYARFLRDAHTSACAIFGTVLGPEANRAHSNHFHVDMAERDHGNYCR
ncbi:Uncharacterized conserved protein [Filomicrobium insigne]|uniref:Uncharacterized conserved protein n=2 Tax=Filomicrobium insigne TaxID=418854 RepID=A0A1H0Q9A8_9HYPH|nr:Uncharacterized conserved protein [Filomicrobium insigne]